MGTTELRKIRGPVLDNFYTRLRRCGNLACTGRPFFEHTSFPVLQVAAGRREAWQQIAAAIREAIRSGQLAPGEELLSAHQMAARYGVRMAAARHALEALAQEELIEVRQGRRSIVHGDREPAGAARARRRAARHDCIQARCQPHGGGGA